MKYILLFLLIVSLTAQGQDTTRLSPKEMFDFNSKWNNVGILQSYVDFSKDVLSSSSLSTGIIGKQVSTTLNINYNKSSFSGKWGHDFYASVNPLWNYYGFGYGISRKVNKRTSTFQIFGSSDFKFQKDIALTFVDVFKTKKFGAFGYSLTTSKTYWGKYEGAWEGEYIVDSLGNWVANIYPIMPTSSQVVCRSMVMYTYTIKTKIVNISPQLFVMSDFYKIFKDGTASDLAYFNDFNLDIYYGSSMDWKITRTFILNTNIRFNSTIDKLSESVGYKKSNPIMVMIGTNFQF